MIVRFKLSRLKRVYEYAKEHIKDEYPKLELVKDENIYIIPHSKFWQCNDPVSKGLVCYSDEFNPKTNGNWKDDIKSFHKEVGNFVELIDAQWYDFLLSRDETHLQVDITNEKITLQFAVKEGE